MRIITLIASMSLVLGLAIPARAQEHQHPAGAKLGTVDFKTSCTPAAQQAFQNALAYLHSFEFGPAISGFTDATKADPQCGIAWWGIAVARWTNPFVVTIRTPAQVAQGLDAVTRGRQAGAKSDRERDYLEAVSKLYADGATVDQRTRLLAYEKAMAALAAKYPDDPEATIFWALSLAASALPTDKTYANQLKAGALLEKLFTASPDHPGITHYIIHSYDVPALADKAVAAAKRYASIAPADPHALHMPSHTFTRVGAWQDSIDTNIESAEAARKMGARAEQLHAMDYMAYAYLQTGRTRPCRGCWRSFPRLKRVLIPRRWSGRRPAPQASSPWRPSRRDGPSSGVTGRRQCAWSPSRASSRTPTRSRTSRAHSARRTPGNSTTPGNRLRH
jgi:hypothetical protein